MQESQDSLDGLGVYYTDGRYSERIATPKSQALDGSQKDLASQPAVTQSLSKSDSLTTTTATPSLATSSTSIAAISTSSHQMLPQSTAHLPSSALPLRRVSDVSVHQSQTSVRELESKPVCSVLPIYRQAPDYDTAIKLKYGIQSCSTGDMSTSPLYHPPLTGSQMDVSNDIQSYSHYKNYADLSRLDAEGCNSNVLVRNQEFVSAPSLHPPIHTYSSPDLASQGMILNHPSEQISNAAQIVYHFKPPPPYPYKQRSSSSTPDLTRNIHTVSSHPSISNHQNRPSEMHPAHSYEPIPIHCAKIVTSNPIQHQAIASSQRVNSHQTTLPIHSYENYNPSVDGVSASPLLVSNNHDVPSHKFMTDHHLPSGQSPMYGHAEPLDHSERMQKNPSLDGPTSTRPIQSPLSMANSHELPSQQYMADQRLSGQTPLYGHVDHPDMVQNTQVVDAMGCQFQSPLLMANSHEPSFQYTERHISSGQLPAYSQVEHSEHVQIGNNVRQMGLIQPQHHMANSHEKLPQYTNDQHGKPPMYGLPEVLDHSEHMQKGDDSRQMGPMLIAAMNGLSLSRPSIFSPQTEETRIPNDTRIQALENRLAEGQVFLEFERILKRKPNADFTTALLPENASRNRFKDVFPYEENRVQLTPTSENKTGYINASHMSVSLGGFQRFYIAAQGPLPNTLYSFWQMVWEHHVLVIVMLTEVQEQGRDKCFPYWPQEDGNKLQIGEFQIVRNFSMSSPTYVTSSLSLCHMPTHQQRSVWHIQYTDWPDHSCPHDTQGFIAFMSEVDAVRRHTMNNEELICMSSPIVVHCSAGVGRSGAVILCDIMLYCLDHNQAVDLPKALTHLRLQRMLTVQTLAQYKFVYSVLIQYLKNSRLI